VVSFQREEFGYKEKSIADNQMQQISMQDQKTNLSKTRLIFTIEPMNKDIIAKYSFLLAVNITIRTISVVNAIIITGFLPILEYDS